MEVSMADEKHPLDIPEVNEMSVSDLFNLDTKEATDAQLDRMIEEVRAARAVWDQEENKSRAKGKRPNPHKGLKLEDLDIDL
jgi:hypothetical protein